MTVRQTLPPDVTLTMPTDDSRFIYASIASLEEHLIWGSLLASLVVFFFIRNLRAVIIASVAIPASIIATFTLMRAMDFTLNNMTLLALTLAVGIVIDDAIVVLENIFRYIEEKGRSPFDAAIEGTREVALPVMATTLSLIVIFLPVAFMTGYARRFIYPFGLTMAFAILVSMIVSFTLTPMLSSRWLKAVARGRTRKTPSTTGCSARWIAGTARRCGGRSPTRCGSSASRPRWSRSPYPLNWMVGRTFVPAEDMNEFTVHADTPQGTSIEGTTEIARNVVKEIGELEGVSQVAYIAGADRYTHFHLLFYLAARERAEGHTEPDHDAGPPRAGAPSCIRRAASSAGIRSAAAATSGSRRRCSDPTSTRSTNTRSGLSRRPRRRRASSTRSPTTAMPAPRCRSPWIGRAPPTWACAWRRSATRCG